MKLKKSNIYLIAGIIAVLVIGGFFFNQNKEKVIIHSENEILATYSSLSPQAQKLYYKQSEELTKPVPERIVELDELTIGCFSPSKILQMSSSDTNLGGQCCGVLKDFEAYELQLGVLHHFIEENDNIELIPKDPYDLSVEHAQRLIVFDSDIILSATQQQIYNDAMQMSHHGGPCCCKCWKWYMMSGLGKKLIVDYYWNAEQLAELWDLSSSCGHDEDTNMQQHYPINSDVGEGHHNDKDVH